ncbi:MAG: manganese efflux pump [Dehalococcoidia bacterium]|nr:manganese efflux pump [Dehalococcoidia bacterium]
MDLLTVVLLAFGLSLDCFAVALGGSVGLRSFRVRQVLRVSAAFGLFQAAMLSLGWLVGQAVVEMVEAYTHWVAFGLLLFIGSRMIWESLGEGEEGPGRTDFTRGLPLLGVSIATSIDSLGVGLGLGFLESRIFFPALVVGTVALAMTWAGFYAGRAIAGPLGRWAEVLGGLVLIGIGVRILLEGLL